MRYLPYPLVHDFFHPQYHSLFLVGTKLHQFQVKSLRWISGGDSAPCNHQELHCYSSMFQSVSVYFLDVWSHPQKKTVSGKHPHILNIIIVYICILCRCHGYCHLFKAIYIDIQKHTIWLKVSSNMRSEHEWTMKSSSHINQCIENKLVRFEPPIWKNLVKFDHFPE